jgi:DNA-binding SARP family transcriptional activator
MERLMNLANVPRFRLLGPLRAMHDGGAVVLGGERIQCMLVALLAAKSMPLSREALMEWIWEDPGSSAVGMLQELMTELRQRLKEMGMPRALVAERGLCRLDVPPDAVDLHHFRKLVNEARVVGDERAADLLRQALDLSDGVPFGALRGQRVENFRITLLDELKSVRVEYADVSLRLGREAQVLPDLAELNRAEPHNERVVGLIMRAHNQNGDPGLAGDVFHRFRKQIDEVLGVEVGKELVDLNQRIIERDPALLPARVEKNPNQIGANMAKANESEETATDSYVTGTKWASGPGSYAAENAVVNATHTSDPTWPGTGAKEVRTGEKLAVDGGRAFENAVFNGYPE